MAVSDAHTDENVARTVQVVAESLWTQGKGLNARIEKHYFVGRPVKTGFTRFNRPKFNAKNA